MSEFPYTEEQADLFRVAADDLMRYGTSIPLLRRLHKAGITVTFPEPRYYVTKGLRTGWFQVWDRNINGSKHLHSEATFRGVRAEEHAHEYADALNLDTQ